MPSQNTTRRLQRRVITSDITAFNGLAVIEGYIASRDEASAKNLQNAYNAMVQLQQKEVERRRQYQAVVDAVRKAEWEFHNAVLALRENVRAQFGPDSNEAQAVGLKKKSERKRPTRRQQILPAVG